jgi:NAD(P)-dependent dehydrogenase (short-subunit alcohol dehydrogenase family)
VALVTGGQQGIGLGIARALVDAGFAVALASERATDSEAVVAALATLGAAARYFEHDLQDIAAVPSLLDRVETELGPVRTLVSNAGVPARVRGDMLELAKESFDFVLGVNLRGGFFLAQETARRMLALSAEPYRSIVFVTSVSAAMVSIERAEYCISKAGASMMAQLFAARLAAAGIGVFELRPGIIETGMTEGVRERYADRIAAGLVPALRWGQPADVAAAVLPLVRGEMAYATGAVLPLDGGLSIPRL